MTCELHAIRILKPFGISVGMLTAVLCFAIQTLGAAEQRADLLATELRDLDANVLAEEQAGRLWTPAELRSMISADIRARRQRVNEADVTSWRTIANRTQWEQQRDAKIAALKRSLGTFPDPPDDLHVRVTRSLTGDGFAVDCLVFESRPGLWVTANLYRPSQTTEAQSTKSQSTTSHPGILICHSHHNPKTQGELQDMGMMWARAGCYVLIMDQLGHGERRQHPFRSQADYGGAFRVSRQDYYFRYNVGMQLHLIGDSLIGWMAWDLMRGVDLLLEQPGVDPERMILTGAVAGGGDPAAVTAAIDDRIKAVVPFNFGGPQPENIFPLPADAEFSFNFVGGGSWESTRNLRLSARDGFLPWTIVAAVAPRRLIYAHEFAWDRDHDPVWKRLETIFAMYDQPNHLSSLQGYGGVKLSSNEASHCNNIGGHHRAQIHPALERWFNIVVSDPEFRDRREADALHCVDVVAAAATITMPHAYTLAGEIADHRLQSFRDRLDANPLGRLALLREAWSDVLGGIDVGQTKTVTTTTTTTRQGTVQVVRFVLNPQRDILVPGVLLLPPAAASQRVPTVVAFAQSGKQRFLRDRAPGIARLLKAGIAVCLPDLRGTGETRPSDDRGRQSNATGLSSSELMLGGTLVGARLNDLLVVFRWLRARPDVDGTSLAVWGDSFAEINPPSRRVEVPWGIDDEPGNCEPMGALLALLAGMFDGEVKAIAACGGLVSVRSVLDSPFVFVPHDVVVPGLLTVGDLPDVAAALAPRPLRVSGLVDGTNRRPASLLAWQTALTAHARANGDLVVQVDADPPIVTAEWLVRSLTTPE